jgi:hypothetical protein
MITVVVPTMWKFEPFADFVGDLASVDVIDEIIIINNDVKAMPNNINLSHPKVKLANAARNVYVNPAWNFGVRISKNDKVCILNDDVIVDLKVFYRVDEFLTKDIGVVGLCPGNPAFNQPPFIDGSIDIIPWTRQHTYGFGSLFFVHKENWNVIPDGLNIYFGDDWAFNAQLIMNRTNYIITNCFSYSPWATTTRHVAHGFMDIESPIYTRACESIRNGSTVLH